MVVEKITKLYESKREDLLKMYYSRAGANDVEDLVQEAFYRSLLYADSYDERLVGDLEFWFISIMNNCLKDLMRQKTEKGNLHQELDPDEVSYEVDYDTELSSLLKKEIAKKSLNVRQVLYLYYICGCKSREVSKRLTIPAATVRQYVWRFKTYFIDKYPEYKLED